MKAFRVYVRAPRPPAPPRFRSAAPAADDDATREAFKPVLARYRRLGSVAVGFGVIALVLLLLGAGLPWPAIHWTLTGSVLCAAASLITAITAGGIRCPACREEPLHGDGPFCPECGAPGLSPRSWLSVPHCEACGRDMRFGRGGRQYTIRSCTHCGAWLDDDGL